MKRISGYTGLVEGQDGTPLKGFTVNIFNGADQIDTLNFSESTYDIGGNDIDDAYTFSFVGLAGYGVSRTYTAAEIANGITVVVPPFLEAGSNNMEMYYFAGGGLLLILLMNESKRKKKRIGELDVKEIMPIILIVGGFIGFEIVQKLLQKIGIWKSPDAASLDAINSLPINQNFWSPVFYTQFTSYPSGALTTDQATALIKQLTDAFGIFSANVGQVNAVFRQLTSQSEVSFLAKVFQDVNQMDLLTYIRGGSIIYFGLTDSDVNTINTYLSQLPTH